LPEASKFLADWDYVGAITILQCERKYSNKNDVWTLMALAYASFHSGDYKKALDTYDELIKRHDYDRNVHLFKACCYYALNQYKDAKKECKKAEDEGEVDEALLNRL